jgi:2'-5' RNA ligase
MEPDVNNSCLMLAVKLDTPVCLGCVFDSEDLKDTGIELDTHITLLYAQGKELPKNNMMDDVKTILGERTIEFMELLKEEHDYNILDYFHLDSFENDSDYLVLKLNEDKKELFNDLSVINKGLRIKYDVSTDFDNYSPHITLAELKPGTVGKYRESDKLALILENTLFDFEDIILSYGKANEVEDRKQYHLTSFNSIPRFFRLYNEKKNLEELYK